MKSGIAIAADKNIKDTVEHVERIYRTQSRRFRRENDIASKLK